MQELLDGVRLDPSKMLLLGHRPLGVRWRSRPSQSWLVTARHLMGLVKR
jgi:hypothetical protein